MRPALQRCRASVATGWANKTLWPASLEQKRRAARLVRKARLKLAQRSRPSHPMSLPPDADRRRTAPSYYILTYLGQRDEPPNLTPSCTFSQDKTSAQCDCYKISHDYPKGATWSYVLITSILNKKIYEDTVAECGSDGSGCLNATNIGDPIAKEAPVCAALRDKTLFPGADLYSDFSPILIASKGLNVPPFTCPTGGGANVYAGCMTAPCTNTGKIDPTTGLPVVKCTCPTYDGPNQVGNPQIKSYSCSPTPHVWSSAYSAPNTIPTEP